MTELHVTTTSGTTMVLDEATVQGFKTSLRGPLLCPGDIGYDDDRIDKLFGRFNWLLERANFKRLDRQGAAHSGIIGCTRDDDAAALASRIHAAITGLTAGQ